MTASKRSLAVYHISQPGPAIAADSRLPFRSGLRANSRIRMVRGGPSVRFDDPPGAVARHVAFMGSDWRAIQVG